MDEATGTTRQHDHRPRLRVWSRWLTAHLAVAVVLTAAPPVVLALGDADGTSAAGTALGVLDLLLGLPWVVVLPLALLVPLGPVTDVVGTALAVAPPFLNVVVHWGVLVRVRHRRTAPVTALPAPVPPASAEAAAAGDTPAPWRPGAPAWAVVLVTAALGAATWAAWLGWDHTYDTAPDGTVSGPYTAIQVVACAATVGLVTALTSLRWNPVAVAGGTTAGFWVCWTVDAALHDDSGLFAVGALLLGCGLLIGTALAAAVGRGVLALWRRGHPGPEGPVRPVRTAPPRPRDRWRTGGVLGLGGLSWLAAGAVLRHTHPLTWTFARVLVGPVDVLAVAAVATGAVVAVRALRRRREGDGRAPHTRRVVVIGAVLLLAAVTGRAVPAGDGFNGSVGVMAGAGGVPVAVLGVCRGAVDSVRIEARGDVDVDVEVADPLLADLQHRAPVAEVTQVDLAHPPAGWSGTALRPPVPYEGELLAQAHGHQSLLTEVWFTRAEVQQLPPGAVLYTAWDGPDGLRTNHHVPLAGFRAVACASGRGWYA